MRFSVVENYAALSMRSKCRYLLLTSIHEKPDNCSRMIPRVTTVLLLTSSCGNQDIAKHKNKLIDVLVDDKHLFSTDK